VLTMTSNLSYANDKTLNISLPPFPPFDSFSQDTAFAGVGIIAIQEVTKNLKVKLALAPHPYDRIMHSLKTGELDLALILKNNIIASDIEYIAPLSLSKVVVLTKNNISIEYYNELYELNSIGVIRSAHFNEKFDQDNLLNKVSVNSYSQAARLLKLDRISGVIGSRNRS
jgi:polar amino acid transport system substrate-binding protein